MSNSLKMSYKRVLKRKTAYIFLALFLVVFILDSFILLDWVARTPEGYQFPHALEVFIMKHDSIASIMPIFLPFFIIGIIGDYLLKDKLSGIMSLSSIRSSRWAYLGKNLLHTSIVIGTLIAFIYSVILLISLVIYPLDSGTFTGDSLVQNPNISPFVYTLLLILTNAILAVGMNLTAQAVGLLTNKKTTFYIVLFLVIFIIPYVLYFGIGPNVLPISRYVPFIVLNETLTLPIGIFMIMAYWIGYIVFNLIFIFIIYRIQSKQLA